jgi:Domain of unknown function (DUF4333)
MSSPFDDQPYRSPDPRPGQEPAPAQPPRSQQMAPPQPYWQPSPPPVPKQSNGLAIAALVVACIALLTGLAFIVSQAFLGAIFGGLMASGGGFPPSAGGWIPSSSSMEGTAPQVVAGQAYPGTLLQDEVSRLIRADGGDGASLSCPATPAVVPGAVVECPGVVGGSHWTFRVTFKDGLGHFTLDEKVS